MLRTSLSPELPVPDRNSDGFERQHFAQNHPNHALSLRARAPSDWPRRLCPGDQDVEPAPQESDARVERANLVKRHSTEL